jgi:hypothetical protein
MEDLLQSRGSFSSLEVLSGAVLTQVISTDATWATVSTDLLLAELRRRGEDEAERPQCGGKNGGWYDTAAHVVALVLILVVSTLSKLHGSQYSMIYS